MTKPEEHTLIQGVDALASRVKLYSGTIMAFGAVVAVMTAAAVKFVTAEVSSEVRATRVELHQYQAMQVAKSVQDSARFERVMEVVELAVVALVEPHGSSDQRRAVANLRSKRHLSLRP